MSGFPFASGDGSGSFAGATGDKGGGALFNPLTKAVFFVLLLIVAASSWNLFQIVIITIIVAVLLAILFLKRLLDIKAFLKFMSFVKWLILFTIFFQIFFCQGAFQMPTISPMGGTILVALLKAYKFFLVIVVSITFTLTMARVEILQVLYLFIRPLKIFKINTQNIALSLIIIINIIPELINEATELVEIYKKRGIFPEKSDGFRKKLAFFAKIDVFLSHIFVKTVKRSEIFMKKLLDEKDVEKRLKLPRMKIKDFAVIVLTIIICYGIYTI